MRCRIYSGPLAIHTFFVVVGILSFLRKQTWDDSGGTGDSLITARDAMQARVVTRIWREGRHSLLSCRPFIFIWVGGVFL